MTPAFWLCLLLVIASGLSAYIGNEWGRKLGKRRLSIFRMRPKHSSTFVTILLSMCLSLGLMGALFAFIPGLQTAFFVPANSDAEQEAFANYENALQVANARLRNLSQEERSERITQSSPVIPSVTDQTTLASPSSERSAPQSSFTEVSPSQQAQQTRQPQPTEQIIKQPQQKKQQRSQPQTTAASVELASRPERTSEVRLESRRIKRSQTEKLTVSTPLPRNEPQAFLQRQTVAALPPYPKGALFELTVNGEINDRESAQLHQGIQRLTKDYLSLLGIQEEALQFKNAQIQQEIMKLSASGQYRLQIALSSSQTSDIPVDVSVSMLSTSTVSDPESDVFDPQRLLEEQRLQSSSTRQSLQQDLQTVLQGHAQQQQIALKLSPQANRRTQSAKLPFDILNIINQNGVIRGELFLR